uniref:Uncharacterized protein n=1 Tax=Physcomitrium patens TaxID=3218 RepID=A0A2K1L7H7_PHYPA|nr:hypothetical protein PHYPA_000420 [Physcomitrium patens]
MEAASGHMECGGTQSKECRKHGRDRHSTVPEAAKGVGDASTASPGGRVQLEHRSATMDLSRFTNEYSASGGIDEVIREQHKIADREEWPCGQKQCLIMGRLILALLSLHLSPRLASRRIHQWIRNHFNHLSGKIGPVQNWPSGSLFMKCMECMRLSLDCFNCVFL